MSSIDLLPAVGAAPADATVDASTASSSAPVSRRYERAEALAQAVTWLREDRLDAAEALLRAWLAHAPDDAEARHFLGVARHAQGHSAEGIALIRQALDERPALSGAWNNLGNVLLESGDARAALEAWGHAARADGPEAARAQVNRAAGLRQLGELAASEAAARAAIAQQPGQGDGWYQLARTLLDAGRVREGLDAHAQAVLLWPRATQSRDQVLRALVLRGELAEAERLYLEWLAEEPTHPVVQHQLAACRAAQGRTATAPAPERASDDYVRQVFDAYAPSFDAKLAKLDYRAPQHVADRLQACLPPPQAQFDIVDLGCGTGLCGPHLRPWARRLAGCDLSVGMLREARRRGGYDALHRAELVHYLETQPQAFDLAVCADTLCYFGELAPVVRAAWHALRSGGQFVFTVEALPAADARPWALQAQGRYAHREEAVTQALAEAGFVEIAAEPVVLRSEAGAPVQGQVFAATRA